VIAVHHSGGLAMNTKVHIDILQGVLDVEGTEGFVKSIYEDFKAGLIKQISDRSAVVADKARVLDVNSNDSTPSSRRIRKSLARKVPNSASTKSKVGEYSPKFNPNLDLSELERFYDGFDLKNHREKILVFAVFMREKLHTAPCSANDIFSCYQTLKTKTEIPEAFVQALRDTQNKGGFVEFVSPEEIKVNIAGESYFNQKIKRRI
jgi:hypothetical protein